jgi:prepilin-type N-terminal cleavage/methylation domain-containing protein
MNPHARHRNGFTLTEVMVAIGVIGIALTAILPVIPAGMRNVNAASESARALDVLEAVRTDIDTSLQSGESVSTRYGIPLDGSAAETTLKITETGSLADDDGTARFLVLSRLSKGAPDRLQPVQWHLRASWPPDAPAGKEKGSAELTGARSP